MKSNKKITSIGRIWILVGIIILLISQMIKGQFDFKVVSPELSLQLGLAFIGIGIVAIILQFKDWREYFQERLKEIVLQRSYLNTLSEKELSDLQVATLKATYKDTDIDREGSFCTFFKTRSKIISVVLIEKM